MKKILLIVFLLISVGNLAFSEGWTDEERIKWFHEQAEQGHAIAQFNLGVMYDKGEGVEKDYDEAFKWYRKAAEQGDADAQYNLGSDQGKRVKLILHL